MDNIFFRTDLDLLEKARDEPAPMHDPAEVTANGGTYPLLKSSPVIMRWTASDDPYTSELYRLVLGDLGSSESLFQG